MSMHIVIAGEPQNGFRYFGPFATPEEAAEWVAKMGMLQEWWIVPVRIPEENQANARLNAAAPRLLQALKAAYNYPQVGGAYQPWMDEARAAIMDAELPPTRV